MPQEIDTRCQEILSFFVARSAQDLGPARYNELFEGLKKNGLKISRPTLSKHLKHLTNINLVTRTEISRANVNYQLNTYAAEELAGYIQIKEDLDEYMKRMDSTDIEVHMGNLFTLLILRQLYQIKYEILKIIEPEKMFEYNIRTYTEGKLWELFVAKYFFDFVRKDEDYREKALTIIKVLIYLIEKTDFQPITSLIPADAIKKLSDTNNA